VEPENKERTLTSSSERSRLERPVGPQPGVPAISYRGVLRRPRVTLASSENEVTLSEAALILGCDITAVKRLVDTAKIPHGAFNRDHGLRRATAEDLATEVYSWRLHLRDPDAYWLTGQRAAHALGVSRARLSQLAAESRVPFVRHQDGTRLYRRRELEMIADSGTLGRRAATG